MKAETPSIKKQWCNPELTLISTNDISDTKTRPTHAEKTFISKQPFPAPTPGFYELHFNNGPAVGINGTVANYVS